MFTEERWIFTKWPYLYAIVWTLWAIFAPAPYIGDSGIYAHLLAGIGGVGLLAMGIFPQHRYVRMIGTLMAASYPMYRALSLAVDDYYITGANETARRVVAVCFSLVVVLSLLIMYPSLWWVAHHKELVDED